MKSNKILYRIVALAITLSITILSCNNLQSNLIQIDNSTQINLNINDAFNERGIYILNRKYYLSSSLMLLNNPRKFKITDDAIWRPKGVKNIPRLSDIEAPFRIVKKSNNDSILLIKEKDTIIIKIDKSIEE
jgi:hypothetical protein